MDIQKLAGSMTRSEFDKLLNELSMINHLGLMQEYTTNYNLMIQEGTDPLSAREYANYDALINPNTGYYKQELQAKIIIYNREKEIAKTKTLKPEPNY